MPQSDLLQKDFSVGIQRGVGPETVDARAVYDHIDGLYENDGGAFARGCSEAFSDAISTPASHPMTWIFDGFFDAGQRTVFAANDDFYVLASDDSTLLNLGSDGLSIAPASSALVESMLFIGGGYIYGGSRKTSNYTTGTVSLPNGSKTVTGSGTSFTANVDAGMLFIHGTTERAYVIASVDSNTQLTLRDAYEGTTLAGASYTLTPFYKITTADPYESGSFYAVCANRLITSDAKNKLKFSEIQKPHKWTFTANATEIPNEHPLPEGVSIVGAGVIGNTVLALTTGGVWTIDGIPFDIVDAQGNNNHRIQILSRDLAAYGQTATWQQALIVPCRSGIFLLDGVSAPRRVSRPVDELYQDYVDRPYRMGQAAVYNDHLLLPILSATGIVRDTLVAKLDRPIEVAGQNSFPWSRFQGDGVACPAYAVRNGTDGTRKLLGANRVLSQIVDCSAFWFPAEGPTTDADGVAPDWILVTRDYETGNLTSNYVRFVRPRYELEGTGAEIDVRYGFGIRSETGPKWGEVTWGDFQWGGATDDVYYPLGTLGESDARKPARLKVNKKTRSLRYRLECSGARLRLRMRSVESFIRPAGSQRR